MILWQAACELCSSKASQKCAHRFSTIPVVCVTVCLNRGARGGEPQGRERRVISKLALSSLGLQKQGALIMPQLCECHIGMRGSLFIYPLSKQHGCISLKHCLHRWKANLVGGPLFACSLACLHGHCQLYLNCFQSWANNKTERRASTSKDSFHQTANHKQT